MEKKKKKVIEKDTSNADYDKNIKVQKELDKAAKNIKKGK